MRISLILCLIFVSIAIWNYKNPSPAPDPYVVKQKNQIFAQDLANNKMRETHACLAKNINGNCGQDITYQEHYRQSLSIIESKDNPGRFFNDDDKSGVALGNAFISLIFGGWWWLTREQKPK